MFFIVLSHFSIFGNWTNRDDLTAFQTVRVLLFDALGPAAAICFFIITGYFSVNNKTLEQKISKSVYKFLRVWYQTFFYSGLIGILYFITHRVGMLKMVKSFLPFTLNEYWFVTCYLLLMLFSPYLDLISNHLSDFDMKRFVGLLVLLQVPALLSNGIINQFLLSVFGYFIGKYIFINKDKIKMMSKNILWLLVFIIYALDLLSIYILRTVGIQFQHSAHFTEYILASCLAIVFFLIAIKGNNFYSRTINYVSGSVFSVYLITEQSLFRHTLWGTILNVRQYQDSIFFPFQGIIIVTMVFFSCILVDSFRRYLFQLLH